MASSKAYELDGPAGTTQEQAIFLCRSYLAHRGLEVEDGIWNSSKTGTVIVAVDDGEKVLVDVRATEAEGTEAVPQLPISEDDMRTMRKACLSYLIEHEDTDSIRYDVCAVAIVGEKHARIRHLVAIVRWDGTC